MKLSYWLPPGHAREVADARRVRDDSVASGSEDGITDAVRSWLPALYHALAAEDSDTVLRVAKEMIADAKLALFGKWRIGYRGWDDRNFKEVVWSARTAHKYLMWWEPFRLGLFACALRRDWKAGARIGRYALQPDLPSTADKISLVSSADSVSFYVELARLILRKPIRVSAKSPFAAKSPKQRARLLRGCVIALSAGKAAAVDRALGDYMTYYVRSEQSQDGIYGAISVDGSIIYHFAQQVLRRAPSLEEKHLAKIARA